LYNFTKNKKGEEQFFAINIMKNKNVYQCNKECKDCVYEYKNPDGYDSFSECKTERCPLNHYKLGYIDAVGGKHTEDGNWNPKGEYCEKCNFDSCKGCAKWKKRQEKIQTITKATVATTSPNWNSILDEVIDFNDNVTTHTSKPQHTNKKINQNTEKEKRENKNDLENIKEPQKTIPKTIDEKTKDTKDKTELEYGVTEKTKNEPANQGNQQEKESITNQNEQSVLLPTKQMSPFDDDVEFDFFKKKETKNSSFLPIKTEEIKEKEVEISVENIEENKLTEIETKEDNTTQEIQAIENVVSEHTINTQEVVLETKEIEKVQETLSEEKNEEIILVTEPNDFSEQTNVVKSDTSDEIKDKNECETNNKDIDTEVTIPSDVKRYVDNNHRNVFAKNLFLLSDKEKQNKSSDEISAKSKSSLFSKWFKKNKKITRSEPFEKENTTKNEKAPIQETISSIPESIEKNEYIKTSWLDNETEIDYDDEGNIVKGIYRIDKDGNRKIVTAFEDDVNVRYIKTNTISLTKPINELQNDEQIDTTDVWYRPKGMNTRYPEGILCNTNQNSETQTLDIESAKSGLHKPFYHNELSAETDEKYEQEQGQEPEYENAELEDEELEDDYDEDEEDIDFGDDFNNYEEDIEFDDGYNDAMFEEDEIPEPEEYKIEREEYEHMGITTEEAEEVDEEYEDADFYMGNSDKFKAPLLSPIGEEIAKLQIANSGVILSVLGNCKITVKGRNDSEGFSYTDARKFPRYIIKDVLNKGIYRDPNMEVIDNTYFNVTYFEIRSGEIIPIDDVKLDIEFDKVTPDIVKQVLYNEYKKFKN
jgi:hypothetical protein